MASFSSLFFGERSRAKTPPSFPLLPLSVSLSSLSRLSLLRVLCLSQRWASILYARGKEGACRNRKESKTGDGKDEKMNRGQKKSNRRRRVSLLFTSL